MIRSSCTSTLCASLSYFFFAEQVKDLREEERVTAASDEVFFAATRIALIARHESRICKRRTKAPVCKIFGSRAREKKDCTRRLSQ